MFINYIWVIFLNVILVKKFFISSEKSSLRFGNFCHTCINKSKLIIYMTKIYQCIFCEKSYILDDETYNYIMAFNKDKDIYFENDNNNDNREFINYCLICS